MARGGSDSSDHILRWGLCGNEGPRAARLPALINRRRRFDPLLQKIPPIEASPSITKILPLRGRAEPFVSSVAATFIPPAPVRM